MKPIIGVTGPDRGGEVAWFFTRRAIARAGGCARHVTPKHPATIEDLDGLILGGGADVDPELYGDAAESVADTIRASRKMVKRARTSPEALILAPLILVMRKALERHAVAGPDGERDELESRLIEGALARDLPILGICRGAQILNVYFGGTLHQDIQHFYVEAPEIWTVLPKKVVDVAPDSHLERLIGGGQCAVNALHHQAVADLGEGLIVCARERNGIVQAIEQRDHPFRIGVQWHPEYIPQHARQRMLFRGLVQAASAIAARRSARAA